MSIPVRKTITINEALMRAEAVAQIVRTIKRGDALFDQDQYRDVEYWLTELRNFIRDERDRRGKVQYIEELLKDLEDL